LITSLMIYEEDLYKTISIKNFYIRRILRIFPAYYFLLLVYLLLQFIGAIYISKTSWLTAFTYTKYFNWCLDWDTSHAWSLSVEEHFYLIWPLLFKFGKKYRGLIALMMLFIAPFFRRHFNYDCSN